MLVPLGFRFAPTHEELISYYLLRRAMGFSIPSNHHILELPLYGENADPSHVFCHVDDSHWVISEGNDRAIYVLTQLSKINNDKTRISRRAGCGTWSGQTGGKRIKNGSGELIGSMKMFSFEADPGKRDDHHWIMHEYSLAGIYSDRDNKDYVICKIKRTSKRKGIQEDDVVVAPPSKKRNSNPTLTNFDACSTLLTVDHPEYVVGIAKDNNVVTLEDSVSDPNWIDFSLDDLDALMNFDDFFACSTGPSIEECIPVGVFREDHNSEVVVSTLADFGTKSIHWDDLQEPDFSLNDLEINWDDWTCI